MVGCVPAAAAAAAAASASHPRDRSALLTPNGLNRQAFVCVGFSLFCQAGIECRSFTLGLISRTYRYW